MSQYGDFDKALPGLKYGTNSNVRSFASKEINGIDFGLPVFGYEGNDNDVFAFHNNVAKVVFDADLVTSNQVDVTVNGVAVTPVVFDTDHDTTMDNIKDAIEAEIDGAVVVLLDTGSVNRDFTITIEDGVDRVVTAPVTLGAGQAGTVVTVSSSMIYKAFAMHTHKEAAEKKDLEGNVIDAATAKYELNSSVNGFIEGWIWGITDGNGESGKDVYVNTTGADQGKITDVSTGDVLKLDGVAFDTSTESINSVNLAGLRLKN